LFINNILAYRREEPVQFGKPSGYPSRFVHHPFGMKSVPGYGKTKGKEI